MKNEIEDMITTLVVIASICFIVAILYIMFTIK